MWLLLIHENNWLPHFLPNAAATTPMMAQPVITVGTNETSGDLRYSDTIRNAASQTEVL
jgi:hypothetical protein